MNDVLATLALALGVSALLVGGMRAIGAIREMRTDDRLRRRRTGQEAR